MTTLAPALRSILQEVGVATSDVELVAVAVGPQRLGPQVERIGQFVARLDEDVSSAVVDCKDLDPESLLKAISGWAAPRLCRRKTTASACSETTGRFSDAVGS